MCLNGYSMSNYDWDISVLVSVISYYCQLIMQISASSCLKVARLLKPILKVIDNITFHSNKDLRDNI